MKRTKIILGILAPVLAVVLLSGCKVDDRFDLSKVNSDITVKVPPIPIGNIGRFTLNDLFTLSNSAITTGPSGDYALAVQVDPFQFYVTVPPLGDASSSSDVIAYEIPPVHYAFPSVPDILSDDSGVELTEMEAMLQIESEIPGAFRMGATMETLQKETVLHQYVFNDIAIVPGFSEVVLNEMGSGSRDGVTYIQVPDLGKLLSPFPDELTISDFIISASDEERNKVETGKEYGITCGVSVNAPLAFSANSKASLTLPVDVEVNMENVGLKKTVLDMDVINSIPLDFSVTDVYIIDFQGRKSEKMQADVSAPIRGGSLLSPAETPLTVTLKTDGSLQITGIVLELSASSNDSVAGIRLNENQGITFTNAVLSFPEGISVQI